MFRSKFQIRFFSIGFFTVLSAVPVLAQTTPCIQHLTIGVIAPLTSGPTSSGEAVKNSVTLATETYDFSQCVKFIVEDDQFLPKNTVTIANKLLVENHVDGVVVYGTPTALAVADIFERAHVPMIALSILKRVVQGRSYVMKHWVTAEKLTDAIADEVARRGYKIVAIVSTENDAMLGLRDLYKDRGISNVAFDEEFAGSDFDFRAAIAKIKKNNPDAVYVLLYPPQTGIFVKQLREQGYRGEVFGVHNAEDPAEVKSSAGTMFGMWFANGDDGAGEGYRDAYKKRFGIETSLGGGSGYDVAKMFIAAARQSEGLASYLHHLKNFSGAFGTYNATDNNDFNFPARIKTITQDGFKVIHETQSK